MLVLGRKIDEKILIGDEIEIQIVGMPFGGDRGEVKVGITAPRSYRIRRGELPPLPPLAEVPPVVDEEVPPRN